MLLLAAGKVDIHNCVTAVALSSDHTPMDAKEAERVLAAGVSMAGGPLWQYDTTVVLHTEYAVALQWQQR